MRCRRARRVRPTHERGAVLVLAAIMLTSLMILAALAIDVANARQSRRQAQAAADAAALAAAQSLPNRQAATAMVKSYAYRNYGVATSAWTTCHDSSHYPLIAADNSTDCISFTSDLMTVRVKLPYNDVPTAFGSVIGQKAIPVSASAEAQALVTESNRIIPAAVSAAMGTGLLCIEQSGSNTPCPGQTTGNFGSLDSPRLLLYKPDANVDPKSLELNYALSLDHDIFRYQSGYSKVCDGETNSPCSTDNVHSPGQSANHVNVLTGNETTTVTNGFVKGDTASTSDVGPITFCGRLTRPDSTPANILDPAPGNCLNPPTPRITALTANDLTVINGRHLYYHMVDWARQAFYPEVYQWETNNPNLEWQVDHWVTVSTGPGRGYVPLTDPLYANGDARLDCFLDGFERGSDIYHDTIPTCPGLTLPSMPAKGYRAWLSESIEADPRFGLIPVVKQWEEGQSKALEVVGFWGMFVYKMNTTNEKVLAIGAWIYDTSMIDDPDSDFGYKSDPVIVLTK